MEHKITEGLLKEAQLTVEYKETAAAIGSGLAEVFATPSLVTLMENTAHKSIEPFLPKGFSSVGIEINVKHLKASKIGTVLTCKSEVIKVNDKKIHFKITVSDSDDVVGTSEHIRYIIDLDKFMSNLK